jgi:hypothetical protein
MRISTVFITAPLTLVFFKNMWKSTKADWPYVMQMACFLGTWVLNPGSGVYNSLKGIFWRLWLFLTKGFIHNLISGMDASKLLSIDWRKYSLQTWCECTHTYIHINIWEMIDKNDRIICLIYIYLHTQTQTHTHTYIARDSCTNIQFLSEFICCMYLYNITSYSNWIHMQKYKTIFYKGVKRIAFSF